MTTSAPPRPPRPGDPLDREELEALVQALIEEARRRARRRRLMCTAVVAVAALVGVIVFSVFDRTAQSQGDSPEAAERLGVAATVARSTIAFIGPRNYVRPERDNLLYVVNPDGSGKRVLTRRAWSASSPAWSPDGRRIAFRSIRHRNQDVYVMKADGSGKERRVTRHPADDRNPAWSPDGQKITFASDRDHSPGGLSEVYVINADGSGERRLTHGNLAAFAPVWSPDGRKIAFEGKGGLYVVNADGTRLRRLTRGPNTFHSGFAGPRWSPDGRKLAFITTRDGLYDEVYVMDADGSGQRNLTNNAAPDGEPAWSPDGRKIAFTSQRDDTSRLAPPDSEVYVMNADGTGLRRLTRNPASDGWPVWSPDAQKIAFASGRDGKTEIYVMNADGSGQRNVSRSPATFDHYLSWSPARAKS